MSSTFKIHIQRLLALDPIEFLSNATGEIDLTTDDGGVSHCANDANQ
jgi:hypothetical protein